MNNVKLVATDLDGTFLKNDRTISKKNLEALRLLGQKDIVRVVATGRNLKKVHEVIPPDTPFDYIVYSSGAGVFNWKEQKEMFHRNIIQSSAQKLLKYFIQRDISFHAFFPAPGNHNHWYFRGDNSCREFEKYFDFNKAYSYELKPTKLPETELCQFLVIIKEDKYHFEKLKIEIEAICEHIRVIRTSSPITAGYIWIEIFHQSVSKGNGVKHICDLLGIGQKQTLGIGNDFNDLDLLGFTQHSFFTENAPSELKEIYPHAPSNENDAFAHVIQPIVL
ncbi:HAD-IIB family hydrolase [Maribellus maritimus]|uniref:HAD-IIB family hydrolase n=1 Tax=Maribellus maritimus TaxID=2870838 RepID=UPI001EECF226|nr:HAD family hydrolase [Maribellus maritimus]MCG6187661.1 Cof-type HAD-IIB family hydrolase [Maribellus maritimus]